MGICSMWRGEQSARDNATRDVLQRDWVEGLSFVFLSKFTRPLPFTLVFFSLTTDHLELIRLMLLTPKLRRSVAEILI